MAAKKDYTGIKVQTFYEQPNPVDGSYVDWYQPFNQATFFNYDTQPVTVNSFPVLPNTFHHISLRVGQYNDTRFRINFKSPSTSNLWVVYSVEAENITD